MSFFVKIAGPAVLGIVVGLAGLQAHKYFNTSQIPTGTLSGIVQGGVYAHDIPLTISGSDPYKISSLTVEVDGKPMSTVTIRKKLFEHPYLLSVEQLSEGEHTLKVVVKGAGHKVRSWMQILTFSIDRSPLHIVFVKNGVDAKVYQGKTLHVQFRANKELARASVQLFSKEFPCFLESNRSFTYECYIPIDCEETPHDYGLTVEALDRAGNKATLETGVKVLAFPFKKQCLNISSEKIKLENEQELTGKELEAQLEQLVKQSPHEKLWNGPFVTPIELKDLKQITTEYGVMRTTQERGLYQHKALDIYATPKSVVWAPQNGIVVLKNRFAHSGNTVVIDHGWGVFTLIFHLDSFAPIEVGDRIKKGKPVGTLGKTGYATGYHVHWEMRVNNVHVDPLEWTKPTF